MEELVTSDRYEVSVDWLKACGMGEEARVFPVIRSWKASWTTMAELDTPNGPWIVLANWRGRYV